MKLTEPLTQSLFLAHLKNLGPRFLVHLHVAATSLKSLHFGHTIRGKPVTSSIIAGGVQPLAALVAQSFAAQLQKRLANPRAASSVQKT